MCAQHDDLAPGHSHYSSSFSRDRQTEDRKRGCPVRMKYLCLLSWPLALQGHLMLFIVGKQPDGWGNWTWRDFHLVFTQIKPRKPWVFVAWPRYTLLPAGKEGWEGTDAMERRRERSGCEKEERFTFIYMLLCVCGMAGIHGCLSWCVCVREREAFYVLGCFMWVVSLMLKDRHNR